MGNAILNSFSMKTIQNSIILAFPFFVSTPDKKYMDMEKQIADFNLIYAKSDICAIARHRKIKALATKIPRHCTHFWYAF